MIQLANLELVLCTLVKIDLFHFMVYQLSTYNTVHMHLLIKLKLWQCGTVIGIC